MSITRPKFFDSPYFIAEDGNWHLKENAPTDVKEEFEEFVKTEKEIEERGIDT